MRRIVPLDNRSPHSSRQNILERWCLIVHHKALDPVLHKFLVATEQGFPLFPEMLLEFLGLPIPLELTKKGKP